MANRIEVITKTGDTRADVRKRKIQSMGFHVDDVSLVDVYTLDISPDEDELSSVASMLSNPVTQEAGINQPKAPKFDYAIEVGFLPGVTDNVGATAREIIEDRFKRNLEGQTVYSSQVMFLSGKLTRDDAVKISDSFSNPVIQRASVKSYDEFRRDRGMDAIVPRVTLHEEPVAGLVDILNADDEQLSVIGKQGIANPDGTRRGPLSMDLAYMKSVQDYFKGLGRNPTDVALESIAQTWSEHCKHTIFADSIDEFEEGLFTTFIKRATNEIRSKRGDNDFCVSVFTDNAGGIVFDDEFLVCDDAVVRGAEPVLIGSILDVNSLGTSEKPFIEEVRQLAEGYIGAAKAANVAIVNGEVAELGNRVGGFGPFNYNWGAGVVWFAKKDRMFTGREIKEGDCLVGLREEGFRSNGLSLVRKIMKNNHGDNWHQVPWKKGSVSLADLALTPSKIYTAAVVDMFGGYNREPKTEVHGVAHITGGGIPGKLGRVLKLLGLGAVIDTPFEPSEFMEYTQALGGVPDIEAYKTWNMGQGMIIITPKPEEVIRIAADYGIQAQNIGMVTREQGIRVNNRGAFCPDKNPAGGIFPRGEKVLSF